MIWKKNQIIHRLTDHIGVINSVQFDDKRVVSGGSDNSLKVWNIENGKKLYTLLGGSLQQRSNNPPHPHKSGCSQLMYDESKIIGSYNSLLKAYRFGENEKKIKNKKKGIFNILFVIFFFFVLRYNKKLFH